MSVFLNSGSLLGKQCTLIAAAATSAFVLKITLASLWGTAGVIWATLIGYGIFYVIPAYRLALGSLDAAIATSQLSARCRGADAGTD